MKTPLLYIFAAVSVLLFSCDNPANTDPNDNSFSVDQTTINVPYAGGEYTFNITASSQWTIKSSVDWCTVTPDSGNSDAQVKVTVEPNKDKLNGRSTKLIIKHEAVAVAVTVSQEVNQEEPSFFISSRSFDIPAAGGEFEFTVSSDTYDFEITVVDSWIHELYHQGDRSTGETIRFKADGHESAARMGVISVCTKDGSCVPVLVNQEGWEQYVHLNIGYRFTATWCGYCPYMDQVFHDVAEDTANNFNYLTFHASSGYPLYTAEGGSLADTYKVSGFPTGILNGWKEISNSTNVASNVTKVAGFIGQFEEAFSCCTGISVNSSITDNTLSVEASVKSIPGDHYIAAFVLESGIVQAQTYYPTSGGSQTLSNFVHDNVVRKAITDSPAGDAFTATADASAFNWSTALDASWVKENLSVAVLVMRPYNEFTGKKAKSSYPNYYIANAVIAPVGSSQNTDYAK